MLRKRERFERTDVPRATPLRTVISLLAIVGVAVGLYVLITTLWHRANQVNGFGDRTLKTSVRSQSSVNDPGEGYSISDHAFTNLLVFTTDASSLVHAQILSLDTTDDRGVLASLPLDTRVSVADSPLPLSTLYAEQGASECIVPVATAANIKMTHVMVAGEDIWDQLEALRGNGLVKLLGSAADVLETINTDMSTSDLFSLIETVQKIGLSNFSRVDVPVIPEQLEDGTAVSVIDQTQLGVQLGMLIAPQPAEGNDGNSESGN